MYLSRTQGHRGPLEVVRGQLSASNGEAQSIVARSSTRGAALRLKSEMLREYRRIVREARYPAREESSPIGGIPGSRVFSIFGPAGSGLSELRVAVFVVRSCAIDELLIYTRASPVTDVPGELAAGALALKRRVTGVCSAPRHRGAAGTKPA